MFDWIRRTYETKTFKVCVGGILLAVGGAIQGGIEWPEALVTCVLLLAQLMQRDATAKNDAKGDEVVRRIVASSHPGEN